VNTVHFYNRGDFNHHLFIQKPAGQAERCLNKPEQEWSVSQLSMTALKPLSLTACKKKTNKQTNKQTSTRIILGLLFHDCCFGFAGVVEHCRIC
jgi:hypothetical protein